MTIAEYEIVLVILEIDGSRIAPVVNFTLGTAPETDICRVVIGDGSVGLARGNGSMKWYEDKAIKDFCRSPKDLPDYSF